MLASMSKVHTIGPMASTPQPPFSHAYPDKRSLQVLRRLADGAMEPIPLTNLSFKPSGEGSLNPFLLPIQLPYILVDRIITKVEGVLELTPQDEVR